MFARLLTLVGLLLCHCMPRSEALVAPIRNVGPPSGLCNGNVNGGGGFVCSASRILRVNAPNGRKAVFMRNFGGTPHLMSSDPTAEEKETSTKPRRRKRVKRKEQVGSTAEELPSTDLVSEEDGGEDTSGTISGGDDVFVAKEDTPSIPSSLDDDFVEVKIKNIREFGGGPSGQVLSEGSSLESEMDRSVTLTDRMEAKSDSGVMSGNTDSTVSGGGDFSGLLADAKRMRSSTDGGEQGGDSDNGIGDNIRNVISTIVTADFFVVCALLLWFLAGVFSSYVLRNDAVQIAFNGIFEPVVQPALGLLMVASAASAFLGDEEE